MGRWIGVLLAAWLAPWPVGGAAQAADSAVHDRLALWRNADGPQLRGANLYQRHVYPELDGQDFLGPGPFGPPVEQADLQRLAETGANLVVLSHPGIFTEDPPFALDPAALANLDQLVGLAAKADLFVVIALRTGPGRSEFAILPDGMGVWYDASYLNTSMWGDAAAQAAWPAMWRAVAAHFRGNPVVVGYDLMVEPNSNHIGADAVNGALEAWDPDEFMASYGGTLYDWNRLYPAIVSQIRSVDPDMPVLVGANGYSGVDWLPTLDVLNDDRVVYTVHEYEPFAYTHQDTRAGVGYPGQVDVDWDGEADAFDATVIDRLLGPVDAFTAAHATPVAVTEFGAVRWAPGVDRFLADRIASFERRGLNWAVWSWPVAWPPMAEGDNAFSLAFGADPDATAPAETAPAFAVLRGAWARNTVRPSNTRF